MEMRYRPKNKLFNPKHVVWINASMCVESERRAGWLGVNWNLVYDRYIYRCALASRVRMPPPEEYISYFCFIVIDGTRLSNTLFSVSFVPRFPYVEWRICVITTLCVCHMYEKVRN